MATALPADPMIPIPYRIQRAQRELSDTFTFYLTPVEQATSPSFAPGQFNMLYAFGAGEVPISISGDPQNPALLVHTIRAVGPVTAIMKQLRRGDTLGVRGPFGTPWPVTDAEGVDVVFVAGGIGLAPLRPAIYHVLAHREKYGNICIYYGARTPEDILFLAELQQWRGRFDLTVEATVDRATESWAGKVGIVTALLGQGGFDPIDAVAMICGPEVMMRYAVKALLKYGVADDCLYVSMERNMKCAVGFCGHCQFGPGFVCKDGPVYRYDTIANLFEVREL